MSERIAYAASSSGSTWTNQTNMTGPPDGLTGRSGGDLSAKTMVTGTNMSTLHPEITVDRVFIGMRASFSAGAQAELNSNVGDKTVQVFTTPDALGLTDVEFELDASKFTYNVLVNTGGGVIVLQRYGVTNAFQVDAVWMRVVYTDPSGVFNYATSLQAAGAGWTSAANMVGPPDRATASASTATTAAVTLGMHDPVQGLASLPEHIAPKRILAGANRMSSGSAAMYFTCSLGDTAATVLGSSTVLGSAEKDLDTTRFTAAMLRDPAFTLAVHKTNTSSGLVVDAVWLRLFYDLGVGVTAFATAVTGGWGSMPNAVGPSTDATNSNSTAATNNSSLVATMAGFADLPDDATLEHVYVGFRCRGQTSGQILHNILLPESTTPTTSLGTIAVPTANPYTNVEIELPLATVSVERLKRPTWRVSLMKGGTSGTFVYLDALYTRAVYTAPAAVPGRARRWTGSAWEDSAIKRYDGAQWVETEVRGRWTGTEWV